MFRKKLLYLLKSIIVIYSTTEAVAATILSPNIKAHILKTTIPADILETERATIAQDTVKIAIPEVTIVQVKVTIPEILIPAGIITMVREIIRGILIIETIRSLEVEAVLISQVIRSHHIINLLIRSPLAINTATRNQHITSHPIKNLRIISLRM